MDGGAVDGEGQGFADAGVVDAGGEDQGQQADGGGRPDPRPPGRPPQFTGPSSTMSALAELEIGGLIAQRASHKHSPPVQVRPAPGGVLVGRHRRPAVPLARARTRNHGTPQRGRHRLGSLDGLAHLDPQRLHHTAAASRRAEQPEECDRPTADVVGTHSCVPRRHLRAWRYGKRSYPPQLHRDHVCLVAYSCRGTLDDQHGGISTEGYQNAVTGPCDIETDSRAGPPRGSPSAKARTSIGHRRASTGLRCQHLPAATAVRVGPRQVAAQDAMLPTTSAASRICLPGRRALRAASKCGRSLPWRLQRRRVRAFCGCRWPRTPVHRNNSAPRQSSREARRADPHPESRARRWDDTPW